jgi:hypothetical protein
MGKAILSRDTPYSAGLHIAVQALALLGRLLKTIEMSQLQRPNRFSRR